MARDIKKPAQVREKDLKEYAGDVVIDVTPRDEEAPAAEKPVPADVAAEKVAVVAAQAAAEPKARFMSFAAWFQKASAKNPRVKLSYKEAIEAHCKAVGLEAQATEEAFDAALKHFGL